MDPELFFPVGGPGPATDRQVRYAQAICRHCPVLGSCLDFALRTTQDHGIWGSLTATERRDLRRARRTPRRGG